MDVVLEPNCEHEERLETMSLKGEQWQGGGRQ